MFRIVRNAARLAPQMRQAAARTSRPVRQASTASTAGAAARAGIPRVLAVGAGLAGLGMAVYTSRDVACDFGAIFGGSSAPGGAWEGVRKDLQETIEDNACGPVLVRLAWHSSGTYKVADGSGGSNGGTIRFNPELGHGANAGLDSALELLAPIKEKYPDITWADLITFGGVVAIEQMGGPKIPWKPGRSDAPSSDYCAPEGRLPDAAKGPEHLRDIFYRQGFNDQEIVALSGAHVLGMCHEDRSGYQGPWSRDPYAFTNDYFRLLLDEKWQLKRWGGPPQYENASDQALMMLPTDMCLLVVPDFRKWVDAYAEDEKLFFKDFAAAFSKLLENGVPR